MAQIYSVFTYYQLITAIQIKMKIFPNSLGDLVISDHSREYEKIVQKLKDTNIFRNIFSANSVDGMRLDTLFKKIKRVADISFNNNNFVKKSSNIDRYNYDEFLFFNFNYFDSCLYYMMKKENPRLICRRFEEGYSSGFKFDMFITGSSELQQKFEKIHKNSSITDIDEMFFYEPDLVLFENKCKLSSIPKFDKSDEKTKAVLNMLFDYSNSNEYDRKYIFFEESYHTDGKIMDDIELVLKIADKVGRDNLMVKLHPRSQTDRFAEYGIKTNKTVGIPWEVIIMNNDFSDKVFLTIASGSVLSPRILFGDNIPTYMLFNCTETKSDMITTEFFKYLEKFKEKFGKDGFYIPNNCSEFLEKL